MRAFIDPTVSNGPMASHALRELSARIGVPLTLVRDAANADIVYGGESTASPGALWIPCWPEGYVPSERHEVRLISGRPCWLPSSRHHQQAVDLISGAARLLAMSDEAQVKADCRAEGGVFRVDDLPAERRAAADVPFVEHHAELLRHLLEQTGQVVEDRAARWPFGKRYAVLLTHDADGPRLRQREELAKAAAKAVSRRSRPEAQAFCAGISSLLTNSPDPYFGFSGWASLERGIGAKSAFYIYVRSRARRDRHDPLYVINDHPRWSVLVELADAGWEVGVHAGIHSGEDTASLAEERSALERRLGRPVYGIRHHYWRIDWLHPIETFRRHAQAGYRYDTSIAWRDRPGFRAGTSLPYQPFDPATGGPLPLIEIPTGLMDGHLFEYLQLSTDAALEQAKRLWQAVRSVGGVLNLDWHERAYANRFSYEGWREVFERLIGDISADSEAWFATPYELAEWWVRMSI